MCSDLDRERLEYPLEQVDSVINGIGVSFAFQHLVLFCYLRYLSTQSALFNLPHSPMHFFFYAFHLKLHTYGYITEQLGHTDWNHQPSS